MVKNLYTLLSSSLFNLLSLSQWVFPSPRRRLAQCTKNKTVTFGPCAHSKPSDPEGGRDLTIHVLGKRGSGGVPTRRQTLLPLSLRKFSVSPSRSLSSSTSPRGTSFYFTLTLPSQFTSTSFWSVTSFYPHSPTLSHRNKPDGSVLWCRTPEFTVWN